MAEMQNAFALLDDDTEDPGQISANIPKKAAASPAKPAKSKAAGGRLFLTDMSVLRLTALSELRGENETGCCCVPQWSTGGCYAVIALFRDCKCLFMYL